MVFNITQLEQATFRAWQAIEEHDYDGWRLRFADGYTRRANSVNALLQPAIELSEKIEYCEAWFRERNQPTHFKMTAAVAPENLDEILEKRGYQKAGRTNVQTLNLDLLQPKLSEQVQLTTTLTPDWIHNFTRLNSVQEKYRQTIETMLRNTVPTIQFAAIQLHGSIVAVGLAVADDEYLGLFDIVTHPDYRQQGLAHQLVSTLLYWGKTQNAKLAYLQVVHDNEAALRLYEKFDFSTQYQYWYRTK